MKNLIKALGFISILIVLTTCTKQEPKQEPENRDFDPSKSTESVIRINTSEIGGNGLNLVSLRDNDSPQINNSFNTVVSKEGAQLLIITDSNDDIRALTISTPTITEVNALEINSLSTAITLVFITPGILNTDAKLATEIIQKIQNLNSFLPLKTYLQNNLKNKSLNDIIKDSSYTSLLTTCIREYLQNYVSFKSDLTKGFLESKNYFTINRLTENTIKLENSAFRNVAVAERDINPNNAEIRVSTKIKSMGGGIPFSWGALFQGSVWSPTSNTIDFAPFTNTSYSELWVIGPGFKSATDMPPISIEKIEIPWPETIVLYFICPLVDFAAGTSSLLKELTTLKDINKFVVFQEAVRDFKLNVNFDKFLLSVSQNNDAAILRELINVIINGITFVTPALLQGSAAVATAKIIALISAFIGAANLGPFIATLFTVEPYCKFVIVPGNAMPLVPKLISPTNNATNVELPITLSWDKPINVYRYELQISRYQDFSQIEFEEKTILVNYKQIVTLQIGIKYYWRVRSVNANGTSSWSDIWPFTTAGSNNPPTEPSNSSPINGATGVSTSPKLSWSCSDPDGDELKYDVYFGTSSTPTTGIATNQSATEVRRTDLDANKKYYWKVVAKDSKDATTTGPVWSFTTAAANNPPAEPSNPSPINGATGVSTSPKLSWSCSDPDGDELKYDVYFGTSSNPTSTISTNQTATSIGRTGLNNNTTHYWKIVAKDSKGASTSSPVWSFTTITGDQTGTVTDFDGNIYKTIKIGNQWWMAENLATTKYNNGNNIPLVTDNTHWDNLSTPAHCWYNNNESTYKDVYGALYNWFTINTGNLCPTGWHVPTDMEWIVLEMALGMSQVEANSTDYRGTNEGGKLKETGTTHWLSPNVDATNESGFTALGGGGRWFSGGTFGNLMFVGHWWTSTETYTNSAGSRWITSSSGQIRRKGDYKKYGFSVRCLKD